MSFCFSVKQRVPQHLIAESAYKYGSRTQPDTTVDVERIALDHNKINREKDDRIEDNRETALESSDESTFLVNKEAQPHDSMESNEPNGQSLVTSESGLRSLPSQHSGLALLPTLTGEHRTPLT